MSKKITRRALLAASLGATQLGLLGRFSPMRSRARAAGGDGPTRLLVLYMPGGVRFQEVFTPLSDEHILRTTPPDFMAESEPVFFGPHQVVTLDGDSGGYAPLRMGHRWNPANPGDREGFEHSPLGYSWVHHGLGPTTAVLHGVDNGSVAHGSAFIGAMCGVAGGTYRAPALVSLIAQHLHGIYSDSRPIPCVSIRAGGRGGTPRPAGIPSQFGPMVLPDIDTTKELVDGSSANQRRWEGSDARTNQMLAAFGASGPYADVNATNVEAHLMERVRQVGGGVGGERQRVLENIHRNYSAVSKTLALDIVSAIENTTPTTLPIPDHLSSYRNEYQFNFGLANDGIDMKDTSEWILSLMKSDVTSVVYANLGEHRDYDTHGTGTKAAHGLARGQMDILARIMGEMKVTDSPDRPGCSLYDDTLVVIQSEFNRSWATGPSRDSEEGWYNPDGHNNFTSMILSGGAVAGGRQIGGFDIDGMAQSIALGLPVDIISETGAMERRPPRAADFVATVADLFGMHPGEDYFIPGGYGVVEGFRRT